MIRRHCGRSTAAAGNGAGIQAETVDGKGRGAGAQVLRAANLALEAGRETSAIGDNAATAIGLRATRWSSRTTVLDAARTHLELSDLA